MCSPNNTMLLIMSCHSSIMYMIHSIKLVDAPFVYAATVAQQLHVPSIFVYVKQLVTCQICTSTNACISFGYFGPLCQVDV